MDTIQLSKQSTTPSAPHDSIGLVFCINSQCNVGYSDCDQQCNPAQFTIGYIVDQLQSFKSNHKSQGKKTIASWPRADIKKLEALVLQYGTDFTRVAEKLGKTRQQVKRKFKVMQKKYQNFGFVQR